MFYYISYIYKKQVFITILYIIYNLNFLNFLLDFFKIIVILLIETIIMLIDNAINEE